MNIKPINNTAASETRADIIRSKRIAGLVYGIVGGLTFAAASWGWDAYVSYHSHAYLPWLGLCIAAIYCGIVGGTAGWLAARTESSLLSAILWLASAPLFAWLAIALPLKITPVAISQINPQLGGLLNYNADVEFMLLVGIAFAWITPFAVIYGTLQMSITEASVFSPSTFGKRHTRIRWR